MKSILTLFLIISTLHASSQQIVWKDLFSLPGDEKNTVSLTSDLYSNVYVFGNYEIPQWGGGGGHPSFANATFISKYSDNGNLLWMDSTETGPYVQATALSLVDTFLFTGGSSLKQRTFSNNIVWNDTSITASDMKMADRAFTLFKVKN